MGFKKVLNALSLFTNGAMSGTNTLTSQTVFVQNLDNIGIEWSWTGTPNGTFHVYGSISGVNFFELSFVDPINMPSGSAGTTGTDLSGIPWHYLYVTYVNTSGSGTLNVVIGGKDLN
jgi:hypothetical protein